MRLVLLAAVGLTACAASPPGPGGDAGFELACEVAPRGMVLPPDRTWYSSQALGRIADGATGPPFVVLSWRIPGPASGPEGGTIAFAIYTWEALEDGVGRGGPLDENLREVIHVPDRPGDVAFVDVWTGPAMRFYQVVRWPPGGAESRVARATARRE